MTRGDPGSQRENHGVDKEWRGEEGVTVRSGAAVAKQHNGCGQ